MQQKDPFAQQQALSTPFKGIKTDCKVFVKTSTCDIPLCRWLLWGASRVLNTFFCSHIKENSQGLCCSSLKIPHHKYHTCTICSVAGSRYLIASLRAGHHAYILYGIVLKLASNLGIPCSGQVPLAIPNFVDK